MDSSSAVSTACGDDGGGREAKAEKREMPSPAWPESESAAATESKAKRRRRTADPDAPKDFLCPYCKLG